MMQDMLREHAPGIEAVVVDVVESSSQPDPLAVTGRGA